MASLNYSVSDFLLAELEEEEDGAAENLEMVDSTKDTLNNDSTINGTMEELEEPYFGPEWIVIPIVFGVIFLVGVIGNGTLIYTVLRNKNMRSTPNVLLVSLALGDLLLILVSVPFSSTLYTFKEWPYGERICKLNEFLGSLSLGVSVFTLTALSGERYMVIVYPMASHRGPSTLRTVMIAVAIWIVSIGLAVLDLFGSTVENRLCVVCPEEWGKEYGKFHSLFHFIVYFALPICIIATFYAMMARMLLISSKQMPGDGVKGQAVKQIEARKKVARLVLSFVIVFAVCWLPRHIYFLWYYFDPGLYNMFWHVFKIVGFCLCFINSCVNPLALYFLSKQFRRYYNRYMFCCCGCARGGAGGGGASARRMRDDLNLGGGGCVGGATNLSVLHHHVANPGVGRSSSEIGSSQAKGTQRSTVKCVTTTAGGLDVRGVSGWGMGGRRKRSACTTVLTTTNSVC